MQRNLFRISAAILQVLLLTFCVLWAWSYQRAHGLTISRTVWTSSNVCRCQSVTSRILFGHCMIIWSRSEEDITEPQNVRSNHAEDVATYRAHNSPGLSCSTESYLVTLGPHPEFNPSGKPGFTPVFTEDSYLLQTPLHYGFGSREDLPRNYQGQKERAHQVVIPAWLVALFLAIWPAYWLTKAVPRYRRKQTGRCEECGYDLRASVKQCPECGAPIDPQRSRDGIHHAAIDA